MGWTYILFFLEKSGFISNIRAQLLNSTSVYFQKYFNLEDKLFGLPFLKKLLETKEENQDRVKIREGKRKETFKEPLKNINIGENRMRVEKKLLDLPTKVVTSKEKRAEMSWGNK